MKVGSSSLLGALVCAAGLVPACVGGGDAGQADDVQAVASALGQPNGDYPSYDERVVLYATNRARMNPNAEGSWPTAYTATPPLQWNVDLNHSSRAHSLDMRDTPCFQHPSCGSTTDDTFTRVKMFYTGPARSLGENIAAGPTDGRTVVTNWINEIGAAAGETGHRDNIFSTSFQLIGAGYAPGGMARMLNNFWTQDFVGTGAAIALPRMTDGIHFPATAAAGGSISFGTTYYDATGAAPSRILVVVDGACTPLALATTTLGTRGTAGKGAYEATLPLADGCHPYYFLATAGGTDVTYPDSGALEVGVGSAATSCALFVTTRAEATCGGGGTGAAGAGGSPATTGGAGGGPGTGAAGGAGGASSSTPGGGGGSGAGAGGNSTGTGGDGGGSGLAGSATGGCACTIRAGGGGRGNPTAWLCAVAAVAAAISRAGRRSRRRGGA
jgi:hypothetical protein